MFKRERERERERVFVQEREREREREKNFKNKFWLSKPFFLRNLSHTKRSKCDVHQKTLSDFSSIHFEMDLLNIDLSKLGPKFSWK